MSKGNTAPQVIKDCDNSRYKQVKISVSKEMASAFKGACAVTNVSMASKLSQFMSEYSNAALTKQKRLPDYSTKRLRRAAIHKIIQELERIKDCEEQYRDKIPENLQAGAFYDGAEEFISCLDSAIEALETIGSIK